MSVVTVTKPDLLVMTAEMAANGDAPCRLADFVETNDSLDADLLADIVAAVESGEILYGGGGGAAGWWVAPAGLEPSFDEGCLR